MAKTGKGSKFIRVPGYTRGDGTKVKPHDRSTPKTATGKQPTSKSKGSR